MTPPSHPAAEVAREIVGPCCGNGCDGENLCPTCQQVEAINFALEAARREEREKCARAMCCYCDEPELGYKPVELDSWGHYTHFGMGRTSVPCGAGAIHKLVAAPHAGEVGR